MKDMIILPGNIRVRVKYGANFARISVRMAPGKGVWINIPYGVSLKEGEKFLLGHLDWIKRSISLIEKIEKDKEGRYEFGRELTTRFHTIRFLQADVTKSKAEFNGDKVTVYVPKSYTIAQLIPYFDSVVAHICKHECEEYLRGYVGELAKKHGFSYNRLSFRNNRTNWGSCSSYNNISLNVKLMMLPQHLIDYVVLHELCHTVEKNHSDRFWSLLESVCPGCKAFRVELKNYRTQ